MMYNENHSRDPLIQSSDVNHVTPISYIKLLYLTSIFRATTVGLIFLHMDSYETPFPEGILKNDHFFF